MIDIQLLFCLISKLCHKGKKVSDQQMRQIVFKRYTQR